MGHILCIKGCLEFPWPLPTPCHPAHQILPSKMPPDTTKYPLGKARLLLVESHSTAWVFPGEMCWVVSLPQACVCLPLPTCIFLEWLHTVDAMLSCVNDCKILLAELPAASHFFLLSPLHWFPKPSIPEPEVFRWPLAISGRFSDPSNALRLQAGRDSATSLATDSVPSPSFAVAPPLPATGASSGSHPCPDRGKAPCYVLSIDSSDTAPFLVGTLHLNLWFYE